MSEYKRPTSEAAFHQNFEQIKPLMNDTEAYYESSRCLFCYDAPCIKACPTGIDIPLFIRQINTGNLKGSAKTIYESNHFGNVCGKVCPTEVLCEGACVYNEQNVKPIEIGRLQSHSTTKAIQDNTKLFTSLPENGKKIAVIGAGPAGIAAACELRLFGYEVDIFEAKAQPSGLALHGTAPYKITNAEVLEEMQYLEAQFGFNTHYNKKINSAAEARELEEKYDAIFLGIGLGGTRSARIEGEDFENCEGATEFIETLKLAPLKAAVGKRVVVIGGGNTAMDAASESSRMGASEVTLLYRRAKEEMPAYEFELDLAKGVGVRAVFNVQPLAVLGDGKVEGIRSIRTESKDGKLSNIAGTEFDIACDMVIKATGQEKQRNFLDTLNVAYDNSGRIEVDEHFRCGKTKYFAAGDAVNGGAEVVNACAEAKKAAQGIHQFLS